MTGYLCRRYIESLIEEGRAVPQMTTDRSDRIAAAVMSEKRFENQLTRMG
jgi:hypothetical protein